MSNLLGKFNFVSFGSAFVLTVFSAVQAEPLKSEIASTSLNGSDGKTEIVVEKPANIHHPTACNVFEDPLSVACRGPVERKAYQPKDRLDRVIVKTAEYVGHFAPLINSTADGSAYTDLVINDSKATNGFSAAAALSTYKNIFWIIVINIIYF